VVTVTSGASHLQCGDSLHRESRSGRSRGAGNVSKTALVDGRKPVRAGTEKLRHLFSTFRPSQLWKSAPPQRADQGESVGLIIFTFRTACKTRPPSREGKTPFPLQWGYGHLQITYCPPAAARLIEKPQPAFGDHGRLPASSTFEGEDSWSTTGLSMADYHRMQTVKKTVGRRQATPEWANDNKRTREVICMFLENRAFGKVQRAKLQGATFDERLARAATALKTKVPAMTKTLDSLCSRYVAAKNIGDDATAQTLESEIEGIDTSIRLYDGGPAFIAGIVYFYYRCRYKSGEIGSELGIKAPHVRQLLRRLNLVAQGLNTDRT
jgi:hypothetical protein